MIRTIILAADTDQPFEAAFRRWKNHPIGGVDFPDTATMTVDGAVTRKLVDALATGLMEGTEAVVGIDIGGLGFAGALAQRNGLGLVDARKVGSIPAEVIRRIMANYELGDGIVISKASRIAGCRVAVVDDCLMSGGTALATVQLLRRLGAVCTAALFVFELDGMGGRERLQREGVAVHSLGRLPRSEAAID